MVHSRTKLDNFARVISGCDSHLGRVPRVPGLRLVIAPLLRNLAINPTVRRRIELDALKRRHLPEHKGLDRRDVALDSIDTRERRSLIRDLVRDALVADRLRLAETETRQTEMQENAGQVTAPARSNGETREEQRARIRE